MLVLTRKQHEKILLNSSAGLIVLDIVRIDGNQVRVGIEAPKAVHILRNELVDKFGAKVTDPSETETRPAA